ncbi:MAG: DUF11 domain-containing protein [Thermoguttaceae bacterium]|nr:DUF11 domain-containing protein [Thermoguttaceae bacterium]MDW8078828.1 hypothetical protein [Thermoguttaceae bacterium]
MATKDGAAGGLGLPVPRTGTWASEYRAIHLGDPLPADQQVLPAAHQEMTSTSPASAAPSQGEWRIESAPLIPREGGLVYPYQPPGARKPWPSDEYLVDGGDNVPQVRMAPDGVISGVNVGDTVACYSTLAGRQVVEPANSVFIYSPRFGAVRQVVGFRSEEQLEFLASTVNTTGLAQSHEHLGPLSSKQHYQLQERATERRLNQLQTQEGDGALSAAFGPRGFHDGFLPHENLTVVKTGTFDTGEFALLTAAAQAAQAWSHAAVLQVFIDRKAAVALPGVTRVDVIYGLDEPPTFPKLRIIKLASRGHAAPGETVAFTIRFDNVGTEIIGNVTIVDNLSPRLEYLDGSAECSLPHQFNTQSGEAGSTILRWELTQPLPPNQGGIIRFQCKVR